MMIRTEVAPMKAMIEKKLREAGAGAGYRWVEITTAAMAGDAEAKAACAELIGRPLESAKDLWDIQSVAHDLLTVGERRTSEAVAARNLAALHNPEKDAAPYLANRLSTLRKERGMTQKSLAQASGVTLVTLQKLENGTNNVLRARVETCLALAKALGITVEELVDAVE